MKKTVIVSLITLVCIAVAVVGLNLSCAVQGYNLNEKDLYIALLIVAAALVLLSLLLSLILSPLNVVVTLFNLVALGLLAYVFTNVILARATLVAAQFTYDSVNQLGWQALRYIFVCLGGCLLAELLIVVGAFFNKKKGKEVPEK
jgi:lysylphosphatidylglycerol synthetase-like protein (DUF2156 family)